MTYSYKTPMCTWTISPKAERWQLRWYLPYGNFEVSGSYSTAALAAGDVAMGSTDFTEWDHSSPDDQLISDLSNWEQKA